MKKIYLVLLIIIPAFFLSVSVNAKEHKIKLNISYDTSKYYYDSPDFDIININISSLKNFKRFEIAPILASRSGMELNLIISTETSEILLLKEEAHQNKEIRKIFFKNFSYLTFKYFQGKKIPDYKISKNTSSYIYDGEKTPQSFSFGVKNKNNWGQHDKSFGPGLASGIGLVYENQVHLYHSGSLNYGYHDDDLHFYFEIEPLWENEFLVAAINYNTYFHQFGLR
ncbi:hypothetical protein HY745_05200, partial [Candidatus Desantisbacteria bacterium]|nr:hypothetical protein [Candidatus Desantisbacteria bacterium]